MYHLRIIPRLLQFRQPAGTSRGIYRTRQVWYLLLTSDDSPERYGIGECAPLPDLSCDASPQYESMLRGFCRNFEEKGQIDYEALRPFPSILFGLETALRHYQVGSLALFDTPFSRGERGIKINGLIWMGDYATMLQRVEEKMQAGFRCIKLKIGAIAFEEELRLLRHIRRHFSAREIELRVDANGAFSPADAYDKLCRLAALDLHSIEQPIRAGQWDEMARLVEKSPLPIALDEELIGHNTPQEKRLLLQTIRPDYLVLKPSLHGGWAGIKEWCEVFEDDGLGAAPSPDASVANASTMPVTDVSVAERSRSPRHWITSALESNIGLNAIAQEVATHHTSLPQGLGTGLLYTNNIDIPLQIRHDELYFIPLPTQTPLPF
jgi:L-alanine-DL-glutamate epimerase-like enolase superfamily enzyme